MLYCKVTETILPRDKTVVIKHINGHKYQNKLDSWMVFT